MAGPTTTARDGRPTGTVRRVPERAGGHAEAGRIRRRRLSAVTAVAAGLAGLLWLIQEPEGDGALSADTGRDGSTTGHAKEASTATSAAALPTGPPDQATLDGLELRLEPVVEIGHATAVIQDPGTDDLYVSGVEGPIMRVPADGSSPATGRLATDRARPLLTVPSPTDVHHAGNVDVDAAGLVWYAIGDGGPSQGHSTRAQDLGDLHGKILRIDPVPPQGRPTRSRPTIRSSAEPVPGPRSGPTVCGIRRASSSTRPPATCG
jgi:hypothetical protein